MSAGEGEEGGGSGVLASETKCWGRCIHRLRASPRLHQSSLCLVLNPGPIQSASACMRICHSLGCAVLLCLVVCLTLIASFFLPSFFISLTCVCVFLLCSECANVLVVGSGDLRHVLTTLAHSTRPLHVRSSP